MSQVLLIVVIVFGSILNVLAKPWSSTESVLERRRNDLIAILLWLTLIILAIFTILAGLKTQETEDAFDLQDWTALVLPFALASPYLFELSATLVRQIEMWRWMRYAAVHALPIAWLYRTMTVNEPDPDAEWLRREYWMPHCESTLSIEDQVNGFFVSTSRNASVYALFRRWLIVLLSALQYLRNRRALKSPQSYPFRFFRTIASMIFVALLSVLMFSMYAISFVEYGLLLTFDVLSWLQFKATNRILPHYDTVYFGRQEMQMIFEMSTDIKLSLNVDHHHLSINRVHNRIMSAVITTAAVLENAFRRAYLVVPVYDVSISNRAALRERYRSVGCELDRLIKQIRLLLEMRHTSGLLSIASTTGTIEASLHNNIESILSIAMYFKPYVLYNVTSKIAKLEKEIETRLENTLEFSGEDKQRERVVYIDARNAMFWLLWVVVTSEWTDDSFWASLSPERIDPVVASEIRKEFDEDRVEILYVIATFMSRCRYGARYPMEFEDAFYSEVRSLGRRHGRDTIEREMQYLSVVMQQHRSLSLLEWIEREYGLEWASERDVDGKLRCSWREETGSRRQTTCEVVLMPTF